MIRHFIGFNTEYETSFICNHTHKHTVIVSATSITMSQSPEGLVPEDKEVTFTCVTDEANPTATVIWTVNGENRSSDRESTLSGSYSALRRKSVLKMIAVASSHGTKIRCVVTGTNVGAEKPLNVECR